MSGFCFFTSSINPAVAAVGMWESHAALLRDFSKPLREATRFVAFRSGVISTAGLFFAPGSLLFATYRWRGRGCGVIAKGLPVGS